MCFILFYLVFVCMLLVTHCFYAPLFFFFVVFCLLISRIIVLFSLLFASWGNVRVEVLGLLRLGFGSIIYFCEAEHPLSLLAETP